MENFFRNTTTNDQTFFNEGPVGTQRRPNSTLSSSISTLRIDQYRQGIELTQQKYFDSGVAKIHSGEAGHRSLKSNFGTSVKLIETNFYCDSTPVGEEIDEDFIENGTIEPLTIRSVVNFKNNEKPVMHSPKCAIQTGNEDFNGASDQVVNSFLKNEINEFVPFIDNLNIKTYQVIASHLEKQQGVDPFDDKRLILNSDGLVQITLDTYVDNNTDDTLKEQFLSCGWDIENNLIGTDSIAYIGLKY